MLLSPKRDRLDKYGTLAGSHVLDRRKRGLSAGEHVLAVCFQGRDPVPAARGATRLPGKMSSMALCCAIPLFSHQKIIGSDQSDDMSMHS